MCLGMMQQPFVSGCRSDFLQRLSGNVHAELGNKIDYIPGAINSNQMISTGILTLAIANAVNGNDIYCFNYLVLHYLVSSIFISYLGKFGHIRLCSLLLSYLSLLVLMFVLTFTCLYLFVLL